MAAVATTSGSVAVGLSRHGQLRGKAVAARGAACAGKGGAGVKAGVGLRRARGIKVVAMASVAGDAAKVRPDTDNPWRPDAPPPRPPGPRSHGPRRDPDTARRGVRPAALHPPSPPPNLSPSR